MAARNEDKPKRGSAKNKIGSMFELPREVVMNLPLTTIVGADEINIENYKGIIEYSASKIRIKTSSGIIKTEGKNLNLDQITTENIEITGTLKSVEFIN